MNFFQRCSRIWHFGVFTLLFISFEAASSIAIAANAVDPCKGPNPPIPCANVPPYTPTEAPVTDKIILVYPGTGGSVNLNDADGHDQIDIHYTTIDRFEDFGTRFIRVMTGVLVLITILVFMIGAGFWIFSAGNEALVGRGKDMMMYAGGGMLMSLGAYVIVKGAQVVLYALGT